MNEIDRYINEIDTFMKKLNLNRDKINEFKVQLEAEFEDFIVERNNPDNKRELEKFFVESLDPPELMARNLGEAQKDLDIIKNAFITIEELIASYATVLLYLLIMFYMVVDPSLLYQFGDYIGEVMIWSIISIIILIIQRKKIVEYVQKGKLKF